MGKQTGTCYIVFDRQGDKHTFAWPDDIPFEHKYFDALVGAAQLMGNVEFGSMVQLLNNLLQHARDVQPDFELWSPEHEQLECLQSFFRTMIDVQRRDGDMLYNPNPEPEPDDLPEDILPWMVGKNVPE